MRSDQRLIVPMRFVWSQKSSTAVFHPGTGPIRTAALTKARITELELMNPSAQARVVGGYQICNDPSDEGNWESDQQLGSFLFSAATTYTSAFTDISSNLTSRFVRFGFLVKNNTGTGIERALAAERVKEMGHSEGEKSLT